MAIIIDELPLGQVTHGLLKFCSSSTLGQVITHFANCPLKIIIINNFYYIRCYLTALPYTGHAVKIPDPPNVTLQLIITILFLVRLTDISQICNDKLFAE